jgi:uncharacterized protein
MKITPKGPGFLLDVKVVPNSSRTQLAGTLGDALKIKIAQPPEDGRANRAVIELLAETLAIPPSQISIVAGHTRPRKTLQVLGVSQAQLEGLATAR